MSKFREIPYSITSTQKGASELSGEQLAALQAQQLVEMKTNFINVVSHELRTPLAGIQSSIDLLKIRFGDSLPSEVYEYLGRIELQSQRMSQMVRDVIDMNRLGLNDSPLEISIVNVRQRLMEIVDYLLSTKHMKRKVKFRLTKEAVFMHTDERGFSTLFTNLIDNALKFSPKGSVEVTLDSHPDGCEIHVIDTGVGIPQQDQDQLFNSFFRASNASSFEGTGLGLVIVRRYAELLGGTISFKSEPGHTEFKVYLPDLANQEPPTLTTLGSDR